VRTLVTCAMLLAAFVVGTAAQTEVYKPGNGVKAPVLTHEVKPVYTKDAMDRKVQGIVEMECVVETDGTVGADVKVTRSLDPDLDQQALAALKQWQFRPGTKDDHAVRVQVNVEMTFTLRDKK
jgi:periplasmic protein TonB